MRWVVHSEEPVYTDPWLDIRVADVELPDDRHLDHRLIRAAPGAGAVLIDDRQRVLLLWRHRFITGSYGWEIPIGKMSLVRTPLPQRPGRSRRRPAGGPARSAPCCGSSPPPGISDSVHHLYRAGQAERVGPPEDDFESERVAWVPLSNIPALIRREEITSGTTLAALLYTLASSGLCNGQR